MSGPRTTVEAENKERKAARARAVAAASEPAEAVLRRVWVKGTAVLVPEYEPA